MHHLKIVVITVLVAAALVLALAPPAADAQTFQYSKGWMPGKKRSAEEHKRLSSSFYNAYFGHPMMRRSPSAEGNVGQNRYNDMLEDYLKQWMPEFDLKNKQLRDMELSI